MGSYEAGSGVDFPFCGSITEEIDFSMNGITRRTNCRKNF